MKVQLLEFTSRVPQSPPVGEVAEPSSLVSPPLESSLRDVNTIGEPDVPEALMEPVLLTVTELSGDTLMMVPGSMVRVASVSYTHLTLPTKRIV